MSMYNISELVNDENFKNTRYYEFLRVKTMSAGIYRLAVDTEDLQNPHTEDEIYHVLEGESRFCIEDEDFEVQAGSIIFVPAKVAHKFHSIKKNLVILVIFAPAEYSLRE